MRIALVAGVASGTILAPAIPAAAIQNTPACAAAIAQYDALVKEDVALRGELDKAQQELAAAEQAIKDDQDFVDRFEALAQRAEEENKERETIVHELSDDLFLDALGVHADKSQDLILEHIENQVKKDEAILAEAETHIEADQWDAALIREQRTTTRLLKFGSVGLKALGTISAVFELAKLAKLEVQGVAIGTALYSDLSTLDSEQAAFNRAEANVTAGEQAIANANQKIRDITAREAAVAAKRAQAWDALTAACNDPQDVGLPQPPYPVATTPASSWGDPHVVTMDQAHYDFQQVGEFVLSRSNLDDFQIQVRQRPFGGTSLTVAENAAFAFTVAGHRVGIYATNPGVQTLIDDQPAAVSATPTVLPGGGSVSANPAIGRETVTWPNGSNATVDFSGGHYLNLAVSLAVTEHGHMSGLLGNDDGSATNDITTRNGQVLTYPPTTADLYGQFSKSWRISQSESLFHYGPGQTTATFTDLNFPRVQMTIGNLPASIVASAGATCKNAGVTAQPFLDDCILDLAETGELGTAAAGAAIQTFQTSSGNTVSLVAASAAGDSWSDPGEASGTAALSFGHAGCGAVNAQQMCTSGAWPVISQAPWIWTHQFTTSGQSVATFSKTFVASSAQAGQPTTLTADADNVFTASLNGTQVMSGSLGAPSTAKVQLNAGSNTITFTVTNLGGFDPINNPAGLAWKLTSP